MFVMLEVDNLTKIIKPKKNNKLTIPSFTLFSTIISNYIKLFGKKDFEENKDNFKLLKLTSAFPSFKFNEKRIFFLPRPYKLQENFLRINENENRTLTKKRKKIKFVDSKTFKEVFLEGKEIELNDKTEKHIKSSFFAQYEDFNDYNLPYEEITELKTLIYRFPKSQDGETKNNELFERDVVILTNNFSFYFLLNLPKIDNKEFQEKIEQAIKFIELEGIGGKRSSGYGQFKVNISENIPKEIEFLKEEREKGILLNNILFSKELVNNLNKEEGYQIIEYGGYLDLTNIIPTIPKPQLFYFEEGSVVDIEGKILNNIHKMFAYKEKWEKENKEGFELSLYNNPWVI